MRFFDLLDKELSSDISWLVDAIRDEVVMVVISLFHG